MLVNSLEKRVNERVVVVLIGNVTVAVLNTEFSTASISPLYDLVGVFFKNNIKKE